MEIEITENEILCSKRVTQPDRRTIGERQIKIPTRTCKETITNIPKPSGAIRFLCFSDWRSRKLTDIIKFTKSLKPKPDIILYAGDDINRFIQLPNCQLLLKMVEKGIGLVIPYSRSHTKPDEKIIANFLIEEINQYINVDARYSEIKPPTDKQAQTFIKECIDEGLKKFRFEQDEDMYFTVNYSLEKNEGNFEFDGMEEVMDLSQFLAKFGFIADFLNQFQNLPFFDSLRVHIWDSVHSIELDLELKYQHFYYSFQWTMKDEITNLNIDSVKNSFDDYLSVLYWLKETLNPLTGSNAQNLLQEHFIIRVTAVRDSPLSILLTRSKLQKNPMKSWSIILKLCPSVLLSYATNNFFEELASESTYGLYAIIGNDCHYSHKLLIQGEKVTDLGETPVILNNFVFLGLEGAESIESTREVRIIQAETECRDIGTVIYPKKSFQIKLGQLLEDYKDKMKIILSHSPPFQCLDLARRFGEVYIGSIALREAILSDSKIKLVVCGHVHLHGGKYEVLNEAIVANCASHDFYGAPGIAAIIDLNKKTGEVVNLVWKEIGSTLALKIWGIGHKYSEILEKAGYEQPEDLLLDSPEAINKKTQKQIGLKSLTKFQIRAVAMVNNKIIHQKDAAIISVEDLKQGILIDIETDFNQSEIWCIGVLFNGEYRAFFLPEAGNIERSKNLFLTFLAYLEELEAKYENCPLYCYSATNFDFRVLEKLLTKYGCLKSSFRKIPKVDIFHVLSKAVVLPIAGYKLKDVARLLSYPSHGTEADYDGISACFDYYSVFRPNSGATPEGKERMKQKLLTYNEEDLRQVVFIWEKLFQG